MVNVVAYLRVSTLEQAQNGYGLAEQREQIEQWARKAGHTVVDWFTDGGVSGSNGLSSRDALPDALQAITKDEAGKRVADGIVVPRLDRLSRDAILQETLIRDVWQLKATVFTTAEGEAHYLTEDSDDPSRKLIRQILGAVNEYEREMVVLRMKMGKRRKAKAHGYTGGKVRERYGYRLEVVRTNGRIRREYVPNKEEQRRIQLMRKLRDKGETYQAIADYMSAHNYKAPNGSQWHAVSIRRIILREEKRETGDKA